MKSSVFFLLFVTGILFSCTPSVESMGGSHISINFSSDIESDTIESQVKLMSARLAQISIYPEAVSYELEGNSVMISLPGVRDTAAVKQLLLRSRMMKLCHSIPTRQFSEVRDYLAEYLYLPIADKPYKKASIIGLVAFDNKNKIEQVLASEAFKSKFPQVEKSYWGSQKADNRLALFLSSKGSPSIDESMYKHVEVYEGEDKSEGILSLELKEEFGKSLGPLTGNDSTYLLHIFHDEVYISKIIEPYIEGPAFSMKGAFSPMDAKVLAGLWNSEEIGVDFMIERIELVMK